MPLTFRLSVVLLLINVTFCFSQSSKLEKKWVDSVYYSLSTNEKIGQLFMVAAYSNRGIDHTKEIESLIKNQNIGGLIFFQGGPVREINLTNKFQSISKTPLLVAMDAEWGLSMRIDSTIQYPRQMTLGAIKNTDLIYKMGIDLAEQLKLIGVQVSFSPVVDVNSNPNNPVINNRSFGENPERVTAASIAYMKGLQDGGVLANAKHFPGHGDTDKDSHKTLPTVNLSEKVLNDIHWMPYRALIKENLASIMVAHLFVPSLDSTAQKASTLSTKIVTDILKKDLDFEGLIFTDALNMKGVSNFFQPGELDLAAFIAGNDVLLFPENVPLALKTIREALDNGVVTEKRLEESVRKILSAKYKAGLYKYKPVETNKVVQLLNNNKYLFLQEELYASALTLLTNENNLLPIKTIYPKKVAIVEVGSAPSSFSTEVLRYTPGDVFLLSPGESIESLTDKLVRILDYELVISAYHVPSQYPANNFKVDKELIGILNFIDQRKAQVCVVFGNAYAIRNFEGFKNLILAYEDEEAARRVAVEAIFGARAMSGTLPVSASNYFPEGAGIVTKGGLRLSKSYPEAVGISSADLSEIDRIVNRAIAAEAIPGCQVLVAKDNKIIYNKSFGFHTYHSIREVNENDLYDIASITKIMASMPALMQMYDKGWIQLNDKLGKLLPQSRGTNKANITLREMLTHQSGLASWIPFYLNTLDSTKSLQEGIYSEAPDHDYSIQVAEEFFINNHYVATIWDTIMRSPLKKPGQYTYSDLPFYFVQYLLQYLTFQPLDFYVNEQFYEPLGLWHLTYKPLEKFSEEDIVPTELDTLFRKQLIQGFVHDPGAAMLGGVGGHAGLFSNSLDLAVMMQMYLNDGVYGGERYINSGTVNLFAKLPHSKTNRRGIGFDKPELDKTKPSTSSKLASPSSFGHSGFTGTLAWADPEHDLIYIFLSNRVYPYASNKKLLDMNVRTEIQDVIYKSLPPIPVKSPN